MDAQPSSILIVGSGVFGLSTAWALTKRSDYDKTSITIVDHCGGSFPPPDCASVDSSRIVRADYADTHYAELAAKAQEQWRQMGDAELGGQGRYSESGLLLMANEPTKGQMARKTGISYAKESWANVARIAEKTGLSTDRIRKFERTSELQRFLGTDKNIGDWGYLNDLSGWTDAGKAMQWLYAKVKATGRVRFVDARVQELAFEGDRVVGAKLADSQVLRADLVMVAAGAWSGSLVDLRGRSEATGHAVAYIDITPEEQKALDKIPVVLNLSTGLFVIPPVDNVLKVARHSFGYINPTTVAAALPESPQDERKPIIISQPFTSRDDASAPFPAEADRDMRRALRDLVPLKGLENRPWKQTRICWYADTRDGDWLVDYHPAWKGLFVATGDSGHGFKFLPVLGDEVLNCIERKGGKLGEKWRWKQMVNDGVGRETNGVYKGLITEDGSRGGEPGMILAEEMAAVPVKSKL